MNRLLTPALVILVILLMLASILIGPAAVPVGDSLAALIRGDGGPLTLVMRELRLPRAVLAATIGAGLGLSGAVMQGYLRNPLAEPGLLGVSGAAALGAVLALQTGLAAAMALALPLSGLAGAFTAVLVLALLAGPSGGALTLILAGIGVSALSGAGLALVLNLSPDPFAAQEIVFWLMGSLADRSWSHVALALPFIVVGCAVLLTQAQALSALTLGEEAAASMGVNLGRLRVVVLLGTAAVVGASTAVAGSIGFIGLMVPHILRRVTRGNPARLLPVSALGGAALLLAADIAVRLILPGRDLKLGVLLAILGAPFFLMLILRTRFAQNA
ncbi:FecCD family ABC transporter permease [Pararhodobacter zhoushanensis]|uniref:Iron ABC transporter permease n=1 Tax=Pararhodobacter zhoushanensis TaxID=2479545 RepID=A0ABT3H261_9RHOB|nr:iron ABC transporter permease [Pararhodobacter zhoushanensis]MCW1933893.1 iron ABC transporter permease [Pararhodobacter zhoushanensis]